MDKVQLVVFLRKIGTKLATGATEIFNANKHSFTLSTLPSHDEISLILDDFLMLMQEKLEADTEYKPMTVIKLCTWLKSSAEEYRHKLAKSDVLDNVLVGLINEVAASQWFDYALSPRDLSGNHSKTKIIPSEFGLS